MAAEKSAAHERMCLVAAVISHNAEPWYRCRHISDRGVPVKMHMSEITLQQFLQNAGRGIGQIGRAHV